MENALLALILAELVRTLLFSLGRAALSPEPFIVIGIVGVMRKMLLTTTLATKPPEGNTLLTPMVVELMVLGGLILILGITLAITRHFRPRAQETPSGLVVPQASE